MIVKRGGRKVKNTCIYIQGNIGKKYQELKRFCRMRGRLVKLATRVRLGKVDNHIKQNDENKLASYRNLNELLYGALQSRVKRSKVLKMT